jgi:hypothetical protein
MKSSFLSYLATVTGYNCEVSAVAFSPCGRTMVSPRQSVELDGHVNSVWALARQPGQQHPGERRVRSDRSIGGA